MKIALKSGCDYFFGDQCMAVALQISFGIFCRLDFDLERAGAKGAMLWPGPCDPDASVCSRLHFFGSRSLPDVFLRKRVW